MVKVRDLLVKEGNYSNQKNRMKRKLKNYIT